MREASQTRPSRYRPLAIAFIVSVASVLVWGLPLVISPLSTDEAFYALGGRTVLDGDTLYVDFWDIKPPLVYLVYAIPLAVAGEHTLAVRVFHLLVIALATGAVFLLARRFFGYGAALFAAGLYAFSFFAIAGFEAQGEAESFMAAPLALAFVFYRAKDDDAGLYAAFASGLMVGIAIAFKLSALVVVPGLALAELLLREPGTWSVGGAVKRLVCAGLGIVAVQVAWVGYLAIIGALSAFVDVQINYTVPYARFRWAPEGTSYFRSVVQATAAWFAGAAFITLGAWAAVLLGLARGPRRQVQLLGCLALLSLLAVWWQGKMFHYHWLVLLPFLSPLAGYACDSVVQMASGWSRRDRYGAYALLAGGLAVLALGQVYRTYDAYDLLRDRISGRVTAAQVETRYVDQYAQNRQVLQYVESNGRPNDSFWIWGIWTTPYFWEKRPLPTRFITSHGLRAQWTPEDWREELMDDLRQSRPRFVVIAAGDHLPWLTGNELPSDEYLCLGFPQLRQFIAENYKPVLYNGLFMLYDRDAPEPKELPKC